MLLIIITVIVKFLLEDLYFEKTSESLHAVNYENPNICDDLSEAPNLWTVVDDCWCYIVCTNNQKIR
uniref:Uncharacterized protein n=1 Tax=Arundo donax TaxID=35708 RepID=A0A0A9D917_ARUDO